ncbi:hypothetical protein HQ585_17090, partial [candidate division KSB1 bacterium]|nr:hypothetical protein [candidate division KSB1 bacterium]
MKRRNVLWIVSCVVVLGISMLSAQVTFTETEDNLGITDASSKFGCAWGDYDADGDLDL